MQPGSRAKQKARRGIRGVAGHNLARTIVTGRGSSQEQYTNLRLCSPCRMSKGILRGLHYNWPGVVYYPINGHRRIYASYRVLPSGSV